jgi:hypothetical protein
MYGRRLGLFLGIGVVAVPVSVVVTLLQTVLLRSSSILGVETDGERGGVLVFVALALGTGLTLAGLGFVQAATARALVEIDGGRRITPLGAYRLALDSIRPLVAAVLMVAFAVSLLASSFLLIPIAIWLAVRWALIVPAVELEGCPPRSALRRSAHLVRQGWLKVASLVVVGAVLALVAGPLLGALLILLTSAPLALLNLVSGVVYAVTMPFVALATIYVYFDMRTRDELGAEGDPATLPAEVTLST